MGDIPPPLASVLDGYSQAAGMRSHVTPPLIHGVGDHVTPSPSFVAGGYLPPPQIPGPGVGLPPPQSSALPVVVVEDAPPLLESVGADESGRPNSEKKYSVDSRLSDRQDPVQLLQSPQVNNDHNSNKQINVVNNTPSTTQHCDSAGTVSQPPVIIVRSQTQIKPFNGTTSWKSYRANFKRVCAINGWTSRQQQAQHLALLLDGPAADLARGIDDSDPDAIDELWSRIERRFGQFDEKREAKRRFETRRQSDAESLQELEVALTLLFQEAWPDASVEEKDAALKRRFEDGVSSTELMQYLRLHTVDCDFRETVRRARAFVNAQDIGRPKKCVRIVEDVNSEPSVYQVQAPVIDLTPLVNQLKINQSELVDVIGTALKSSGGNQTRAQSPAPSKVGQESPQNRPPTQQNDRGRQPFRQNAPPAFNRSASYNNNGFNNNRGNGRYSPGPQQNGGRPQNFGQNSGRPSNYSQNGYRPSNNGRTGPPYGPRTASLDRFQSGNRYGRDEGMNRPPRPNPGCYVCGRFGCHSDFHQTPRGQDGQQNFNRTPRGQDGQQNFNRAPRGQDGYQNSNTSPQQQVDPSQLQASQFYPPPPSQWGNGWQTFVPAAESQAANQARQDNSQSTQ